MTDDRLKDNSGLKYDHRNLLTEISRLISENETELTRYYYDEAGNRVRKLIMRYWSGGGGTPDPPNWGDIENLPIYEPEGEGGDGWSIYKNEYYVRGVGGNTIAEYDWETLQQWNVYGTDNVGKITKDGEEENKFFYLKDHLGSIRAVIDENNTVVSAQDYDMWGFLLENRTFDIERGKYKFTSKERDNESSYDYFGARYYMSRIGRWGGVDPKYNKYFSFTPYNYSIDNPVTFFDPNGEDAIYIYYLKYNIDVSGKNIPGIGHAGVMLIDNKTGEAIYYDFGRYGEEGKGIVRKEKLEDITIKEGKLDESIISERLEYISKEYGKGSEIGGAYIESEEFKKMKEYAEGKYKETNDPTTENEYCEVFNNCAHFGIDVIKQDESIYSPPPPPIMVLPKQISGWYSLLYGDVYKNQETNKYEIEK